MVERLGLGHEESPGRYTLPSFVEAEWWDPKEGLVWHKEVVECPSEVLELAVDPDPKLLFPGAVSPRSTSIWDLEVGLSLLVWCLEAVSRYSISIYLTGKRRGCMPLCGHDFFDV
jgi:hypothetical protein